MPLHGVVVEKVVDVTSTRLKNPSIGKIEASWCLGLAIRTGCAGVSVCDPRVGVVVRMGWGTASSVVILSFVLGQKAES